MLTRQDAETLHVQADEKQVVLYIEAENDMKQACGWRTTDVQYCTATGRCSGIREHLQALIGCGSCLFSRYIVSASHASMVHAAQERHATIYRHGRSASKSTVRSCYPRGLYGSRTRDPGRGFRTSRTRLLRDRAHSDACKNHHNNAQPCRLPDVFPTFSLPRCSTRSSSHTTPLVDSFAPPLQSPPFPTLANTLATHCDYSARSAHRSRAPGSRLTSTATATGFHPDIRCLTAFDCRRLLYE